MKRQKYMLLTNLHSTKYWIEEVFEEIKDDLAFDIDVIYVGGKVYTSSSQFVCFDGYLMDTIIPTPKTIRGREVQSGTVLVANRETHCTKLSIVSKIRSSNYDNVINVMDLDPANQLLFDWLLDMANVPLSQKTGILPLTSLQCNNLNMFGKLDKELLIILLKQIPFL